MSERTRGTGLVSTEALGSCENVKVILSTSESTNKSLEAQSVRSRLVAPFVPKQFVLSAKKAIIYMYNIGTWD